MDRELQRKILRLYAEDLTLREQFVASNYAPEIGKQIYQLDQDHVQALKEIIETVGWPGYQLVGEQASHAMWLLVQHTPDQPFQRLCLSMLQEAVQKGDASSIDLAYLTDRVFVNEGKKQRYGTQWKGLPSEQNLYPVEDPAHLDERRRAVGLNSLEESLKQLLKDYKVKEDI